MPEVRAQQQKKELLSHSQYHSYLCSKLLRTSLVFFRRKLVRRSTEQLKIKPSVSSSCTWHFYFKSKNTHGILEAFGMAGVQNSQLGQLIFSDKLML